MNPNYDEMRSDELAAKLTAANRTIETLRETLALWQQAFGLATTVGPEMEIDIRDPLGMARKIERHVLLERAALAAMQQRAEAAKMATWIAGPACPLCSAPGTRVSYDDANSVQVSYCLHCKCAILWEKSEVQS